MAFEIENFKEVGGPGNSPDGGQIFSVFSSTDNLSTMVASGYFNDLIGKISVNVRDFIWISATDGATLVQIKIKTTSLIELKDGILINSPVNQVTTPSGSGTALDFSAALNLFTSTGGSGTQDMTAGVEGEKTIITMVVDNGDFGLLSNSLVLGVTSMVFSNVGHTVELLFSNGLWTVVSRGVGPVIT